MDTSDPEVSEVYRRSEEYPKFDLYSNRFAPFIHLRKGITAIPLSDYPKYVTLKLLTTTMTSNGIT